MTNCERNSKDRNPFQKQRSRSNLHRKVSVYLQNLWWDNCLSIQQNKATFYGENSPIWFPSNAQRQIDNFVIPLENFSKAKTKLTVRELYDFRGKHDRRIVTFWDFFTAHLPHWNRFNFCQFCVSTIFINGWTIHEVGSHAVGKVNIELVDSSSIWATDGHWSQRCDRSKVCQS